MMTPNVKQVIPFLHVSSMEPSLRYYLDGLGFVMKHSWEVNGKIRWCLLQLGGAAIMLQQFTKERTPAGKVGVGMSLCFQCADALAIYDEVRSRGLEATEPFVGNELWVTSLTDPDGFQLSFSSPTDTPEETKLSEVS